MNGSLKIPIPTKIVFHNFVFSANEKCNWPEQTLCQFDVNEVKAKWFPKKKSTLTDEIKLNLWTIVRKSISQLRLFFIILFFSKWTMRLARANSLPIRCGRSEGKIIARKDLFVLDLRWWTKRGNKFCTGCLGNLQCTSHFLYKQVR